MPPLDLSTIPVKSGSRYPAPHAAAMAGRSWLALGDAGGLTQFGVNLVTLVPGGISSLRHWHHHEDEFLIVTEGECVLVEDEGEFPMRPGDCAAFPSGVANGHHMLNRTDRPAKFLVVGSRLPLDVAEYSDIDMKVTRANGGAVFTHKDGSPYGTRAEGDSE